jgi:endonuclease/exonuclease/phosphatase family metal-dependent hydrolase
MCSEGEVKYLRVASFNLLAHPYTKFSTLHHSGPGAEPRALETEAQQQERYAKNTAVIEKLGADVLLTQEHDFAFHVSTSLYPYQASVATADREESCAVLAKEPITHSRGIDLGDGKTAVVASLASGVTVVSLHLKGGAGSETAQRAQLQRILQFLQPYDGVCVLAGDMNCTNPEAVHGEWVFRAAGFEKVSGKGVTGMTSDFSKQLELDHVYVRGARHSSMEPLVYTPKSPWLVDAAVGSDHVPLVAAVAF